MRSEPETDRALAPLVSSLDEEADGAQLAHRAGYSRAQYYRIVKDRTSAPPMAVRRRLLIERAAWQLIQTGRSVTEIAFDAGFESLEGFSRSFKASYGVSPRHFRTLKPTDYRVDLTERIHFAPTAAEPGPPRQGEFTMKLFERMIDHHGWSTHRTLDACRGLDEAQLDRELDSPSPFPWEDCRESIRKLLQSNVAFAEPWLEALNGARPEYDRGTIDGLHEGLDKNCEQFQEMVHSIEKEGRWDLTFVDSLCCPPEVFSYVGMVGHAITFTAHRRVVLLNELKRIGITDLGFGDPIEYDPARRDAPMA